MQVQSSGDSLQTSTCLVRQNRKSCTVDLDPDLSAPRKKKKRKKKMYIEN